MARADLLQTPLSDARVQIVTALAGAVLTAAGPSVSSGAPTPAETAAAVEAGFVGLSSADQATVDAILDAVNVAPTQGAFLQLSSEEQQAFLHSTFSAVTFNGPIDTTFLAENQASYNGYLAAVQSGSLPADPTDLGEPPEADGDGSVPLASSPPPPTPISPAQILEGTVFAALALIDNPPPPASTVSGLSTGAAGAVSALGDQVIDLLGSLGIQSDTLDAAVVSVDEGSVDGTLPVLSNTLLTAIATWSSS